MAAELVSKNGGWGSDAIVEQLSRLDLRYIAQVPGSSYRGLHDSLVNYNGGNNPEMLTCLHEEHSVALAHGYAKVTERPMAVAMHANVGLMHATMAIYNAFCDRVPMVLLGATGPLDAAKRRPWIDWIHTAADQAALIRAFIKFDDQPMSVNAAIASLTRATAITSQIPRAPVYICLDVELQENPLQNIDDLRFMNPERHIHGAATPGAAPEDVQIVLSKLQASRRPLLLFGRVDRTKNGWDERIRLAEHYNARVLTDIKQAAAFPNHHHLHAAPASVMPSPQTSEVVRHADVIVSFEWVDLAGTLQGALGGVEPTSHIVHVSLDASLHNGWSKDHFGQPPSDHQVVTESNKFISALLEASVRSKDKSQPTSWEQIPPKPTSNAIPHLDKGEAIAMEHLAEALYANSDPDKTCLVRIPLGWKGDDLRATHPLAFLGMDGGAGIGSGPGQAVGAALALKNTPYLTVAVLGDGDFMMGSTAIWTAVRHRLPLLLIIANNFSFFNDEMHQERVARTRKRPVENKGVGIRIDEPAPHIGQHAASLGATVLSEQVTKRSQLHEAIRLAVQHVREKKSVVLVDVLIPPEGYSAALGESK
jgi:thiamine pyrophosphate-dependent acetolactate synthase large subunit-like protein